MQKHEVRPPAAQHARTNPQKIGRLVVQLGHVSKNENRHAAFRQRRDPPRPVSPILAEPSNSGLHCGDRAATERCEGAAVVLVLRVEEDDICTHD
jgi:hypothetical protein